MLDLPANAQAPQPLSYWEKRRHLLYLQTVRHIVCAVGHNAQSLLDVGSRACGYLQWFPWIEDRVSLDLDEPYEGPGVRSITADFFTWEPDKRYDVALCLQVLEHIPDAPAFAGKLLGIADHVVVSVPYKWKEGAEREHVHDPVDSGKFHSWFDVKPTWQAIVQEPLSVRNGRRIVAYFDTKQPSSKRFKAARSPGRARLMETSEDVESGVAGCATYDAPTTADERPYGRGLGMASRQEAVMSEKVQELKKKYRKLTRRNSGLGWARLPALVPAPETVIDVGAAGGTIGLYRAFPDSKIIAIDPLHENMPRLKKHAENFDMEIHACAVGRERGRLPINVGDGKRGITSLLTRTGPLAKRIVETRTVEIYRLDELIEPRGTIGLKIDAEGAEPQVIEGATGLLPNVEWVVAEVSMAPRFKEDRLFAGLYDVLAPHGFIFRDIVEIVRQRDGDLRRIDAVFVKPDIMNHPVRDLNQQH